jgi:hypothetical protein
MIPSFISFSFFLPIRIGKGYVSVIMIVLGCWAIVQEEPKRRETISALSNLIEL